MNIRPRVFIGSSIEGLEIAQALQINLDYVAEVSLWTDNIFELSTSTMGSLNQILNQVDYSIFVLTPDDLTKSRDTDFFSPRDNVIFELGLFSGKIGLNRTFIVHPRNIKLKIPTDLLGITTATYEDTAFS